MVFIVTLVVMCFVSLLFPFLIETRNYIESRSKDDQEMATVAEKLTARVHRIDQLNVALKNLYAGCAAGISAPAVAALRAKGELIAGIQEIEVFALRKESLALIKRSFQPMLQIPSRIGIGPCGLPAQLLFAQPERIAQVSSKYGGFRVQKQARNSRPFWRYESPIVRFLP